jgi:DNA repair protein RecN (Recombination protein N)
MLKHLHIRNYALIRDQSLDFEGGLVVFTGETGSGKSILLGALGLIMGDRADTRVVFNPDEKCLVEATFDVRSYALQPVFEAHDLDYDEELIIRREIAPGGKSRAFINDTPVSLSVLQEFSAVLVDLHQQFDTLELVNASFQINVVDAIAGLLDERNAYQKKYREYLQKRQALERLQDEERRALAEKDYIMFQWQELEEAAFEEEEQEQLESELQTLSHADDIRKQFREAIQLLDEADFAILQQLPRVVQLMQQTGRLYAPAAGMADRMDSIQVELSEILREMTASEESVEMDPERLQQVEERLQLLYRLLKKHQVTELRDLLSIQSQLQEKATRFESLGDSIRSLQQEYDAMKAALVAHSVSMHQARLAACAPIESEVQRSLADMNMEQARIRIEIRSMEDPGPLGMDQVRFLVATNKGSAFLPIKDIASGGELSRIALAVKSLVAKALAMPTMIFDEIDTGVSGQVALQMGQMLKKLSTGQQVMVITHTAQVAARADQHLVVYKSDESGSTTTRVRGLSADERIHTLAVMLSTNPPSPSAIENARELISLS